MDQAARPSVKHAYQNAVMNSTRWEGFVPRDDDIVITTSYKAGTTWMQGICAALVFQAPTPPVPQDELTPWLDANFSGPVQDVLAHLDGLTNRRYIKTHLPLDGLIFHDSIKYIVIGRDGPDVFMSMWNHWHNMKQEFIDLMNNAPDRIGPTLPSPPDDVKQAFDEWLVRGSFDWETDGYPFWSHLSYMQTWWDYRDLDNILFVHFADLLKDLDAQMRRISAYLGIPVNEEIWQGLVKAVTFAEMKSKAAIMAPGASQGAWKDASNFFHKGTNRRWEGSLSDEQIKHYREVAKAKLEPELEDWLEHGGVIS